LELRKEREEDKGRQEGRRGRWIGIEEIKKRWLRRCDEESGQT
jgi:hypothetical protein